MTRMRIALTIGLIVSGGTLARAEDITVSTYYPSPRGVYQQLRTTNNTFLATLAGNVGIGMEAPGSRLVVQGAGATNATSSLNVTNNAAASMFFVRDDGNVGIGTVVPNGKLDVNGTQYITGGAADSGYLVFKPVAGATFALRAVNGGHLQFANDNGVELARITQGGNVGIGTPNPGFKLEVRSAIAGQAAYIRSDATSGTNYGVDAEAMGAGATTNIGGYFAASGATNNYAIIVPPGFGNVGIGTVAPAYPLDVQGKIGGKLDGGANNGELKVSCPGDGNCYAVYGPP